MTYGKKEVSQQMAMIRLEGLKDRLQVEVLRERLGAGITATSTLKDGRPGFELILRPAKGDNKIIYEGRLKYPMFVQQGRLVHPTTNVYGCLCDFKEEGIQAITLKKSRGVTVQKAAYVKIDQILMAVLRRHLLAKLLGVELEYKISENLGGSLTDVYVVKNPGLWGRQSCGDFQWSDEALDELADLRNNPEEGKRGLYKVCKNCLHRDYCGLCLQIKANRKRVAEQPAEVAI
jgi:hypothetical protein